MSGDSRDGPGSDQFEALLTEWESLQNDIRRYQDQYHRRVVRGIVVLAAVAGYAVQAPARWLLIFIPIIIGLIFIVHVQEANNVYYRSWQCYLIEEELQIDVFDWTKTFAGLTRPNTLVSEEQARSRFDLSWRLLPAGAAYGLGALVYGGFATYSALVVIPAELEAYGTFLGIPDWLWGAAFYGSFTGILIVVGYTHWSIRLEFKDENAERPSE